MSVALLALLGGAALAWLRMPLRLAAPAVEVEVVAGSSMRQVARNVSAAGVGVPPWVLEAVVRLRGQAQRIKAGSYEVTAGMSTLDLVDRLVRGDALQGEFVLVEGWSFRRLRSEIAALPGVRHDTAGLGDADLMARIGAAGVHPEGRFLPDTYFFVRGGSDIQLFARAYRAMQRKLDAHWAARDTAVPLATADELLVLASIVEKETGVEADRGKVASVFVNRLRSRMPLQTDPTVIYGMGEAFDGNLRRIDLLTDTAYNTYTRRGLPPTPISMPGAAALAAAARPPATEYFYFVARGDGSSQFSRTLDEHNRAVARFQKRRAGG